MTKFRKLLISAISVSLFLVFGVSSAMAAPYTVSYVVTKVPGGLANSDNSGTVYDSDSTASTSTSGATSYAEATANATFGALGVYASAEVNGSGIAEASGTAYFLDAITVTSDTLAVGTPVTLLLNETIDGGFYYDVANYISGYFKSTTTIGNEGYNVYESIYLYGDYEYTYEDTVGDTLFQTTVGAYLKFYATLDVVVSSMGNSFIEGAFGDTVNYYLDSQTAGVSLTSDSGHDYTTPAATPNPVPEPGTILLLGSGLAGFGLFGRKAFRKG